MFKVIFRRAGKDKVLTDLGFRDYDDISRRLQKCKNCVNSRSTAESCWAQESKLSIFPHTEIRNWAHVKCLDWSLFCLWAVIHRSGILLSSWASLWTFDVFSIKMHVLYFWRIDERWKNWKRSRKKTE